MVIERVIAHNCTIFPLHLGVERLLSWAINQQSGLPNNDGDDSDGGDGDGNECDGDDGNGDGDGDGDGGDYQHHQQVYFFQDSVLFAQRTQNFGPFGAAKMTNISNGDDIYIMMKCLFVTKNHHFLL